VVFALRLYRLLGWRAHEDEDIPPGEPLWRYQLGHDEFGRGEVIDLYEEDAVPYDACDECGERHACKRCVECCLLICDAHHECPDCGDEDFVLFREDQNHNDPDSDC
jgi:hypothetical protein